MDGCLAATADLLVVLRLRAIEEGDQFYLDSEKLRLCRLLDKEYAISVYRSSVSQASVQSQSMSIRSEALSTKAKRAEAAAKLAAKRVELKWETVIEAQREKLQRLENQREAAIEALRQLKGQATQKDADILKTKVRTCSEESKQKQW